MGIDWSRMSPKQDCDQRELTRLVEQQATALQGMPYFWSVDLPQTPTSFHEETRRKHEQQYLSSSQVLRELLAFPSCDPDTGVPKDHPDLDPCWRVYPITHNTIFPPRWRKEALRTVLPSEFPTQIAAWKAWAQAVAEGQHQDYLVQLYLYETTMFLVSHCEELKAVANASLSKTGKWASKPELAAVREKILALPTPAFHPAPVEIAFSASRRAMAASSHVQLAALWNGIEQLIGLTRAWDRTVRGGWKLRYYEHYYQTFQQYLGQCQDGWLQSFFIWAERCASLGFGLFLDF